MCMCAFTCIEIDVCMSNVEKMQNEQMFEQRETVFAKPCATAPEMHIASVVCDRAI